MARVQNTQHLLAIILENLIEVRENKIMKKFIEFFIVSVSAVILWEYGHPYIPGLVTDHGHEHIEVKSNTNSVEEEHTHPH